MNDPVRRAYARLGLPAHASPAAVKRRFRTLARIWHPDRFASDPVGQKEATERMAQINHDYQLLSLETGAARGGAHPGDSATPRPLSPPEVDSLISAIGAESPIDLLFGEIDYFYFGLRNPPRLFGSRGRVVSASLTAFAGLGALWAGWTAARESGGHDALAWFMFGAAGLLGFVATIEIREFLRGRRSR